MRKHLEIQRVAGRRIGILRLVAHDAHVHAVGVAAMEGQLVVAGVATLGADDVAGDGHRRAVGDEVEGGAGIAGAQVECRQIAVAVDRDGGGDGGVESRGRLSHESVLILARAERCGVPPSSKSGRVMVPSALPVAVRGRVGHILFLGPWGCRRRHMPARLRPE